MVRLLLLTLASKYSLQKGTSLKNSIQKEKVKILNLVNFLFLGIKEGKCFKWVYEISLTLIVLVNKNKFGCFNHYSPKQARYSISPCICTYTHTHTTYTHLLPSNLGPPALFSVPSGQFFMNAAIICKHISILFASRASFLHRFKALWSKHYSFEIGTQ
jgi:hypothetical protein